MLILFKKSKFPNAKSAAVVANRLCFSSRILLSFILFKKNTTRRGIGKIKDLWWVLLRSLIQFTQLAVAFTCKNMSFQNGLVYCVTTQRLLPFFGHYVLILLATYLIPLVEQIAVTNCCINSFSRKGFWNWWNIFFETSTTEAHLEAWTSVWPNVSRWFSLIPILWFTKKISNICSKMIPTSFFFIFIFSKEFYKMLAFSVFCT